MGLLAGQLAAGNTVAATVAPPGVAVREYDRNDKLWEDILGERQWPTAAVTLRHFWLSEWLPLCPGLFHTAQAKASRRLADQLRLTGGDRAIEQLSAAALAAGGAVSDETLRRLGEEAITVYLPHEKTLMLEGGVGCIRLRPRERQGEPVWFLGASSTPFAHEGIIVALSQKEHDCMIGTVREAGAVRCTIEGRLAYLPSEFDPLYREAVGVPQLHLEVERLIPDGVTEREAFLATGAVLVRSERTSPQPRDRHSRLARGIGAAFVSFEPGVPRSIEHACEWLATAYAGGVMRGEVITDFDEQVRRFPRAIFELNAIHEGTVPRTEVIDVLDRLDLPRYKGMFINRLEVKGDLVMARDQYNVSGQAGAVGPDAQAERMSFLQLGMAVPDAVGLAQDLAELRTHLRSQVTELEHDEALGILAEAERAAHEGDANTAVEKLSGLRRLKTAGPWVLGAATSIGTGVAAGVLKVFVGA
jgi:hypothetical protein